MYCHIFRLGSFSHSLDHLRERPNLSKTKMCPSVEAGQSCGDGEECPYAHSLVELRATPMLFRTVMCSWWRKGQCEFGDNCRFAHGENQLRESTSDQSLTSESVSRSSSFAHSLNKLDQSSPAASVDTPVAAPVSPLYAAVFSAALAAATAACYQHGLPVLSPQQTVAVAAAASAAAPEAISQAAPRAVSPPSALVPEAVIRAELNKLKKGFASSPALLSFFDDSDEEDTLADWIQQETAQVGRPRSGSDPTANNSDHLMEELRKLWTQDPPAVVGVPLMRSDPYLSASHMTLDSSQINID